MPFYQFDLSTDTYFASFIWFCFKHINRHLQKDSLPPMTHTQPTNLSRWNGATKKRNKNMICRCYLYGLMQFFINWILKTFSSFSCFSEKMRLCKVSWVKLHLFCKNIFKVCSFWKSRRCTAVQYCTVLYTASTVLK